MRRTVISALVALLVNVPALTLAQSTNQSMKAFCRERSSTAKEVNLCMIELRKAAAREAKEAKQQRDADRREARAAAKQRKREMQQEAERMALEQQRLALEQQQAAQTQQQMELERLQLLQNIQNQGAQSARARNPVASMLMEGDEFNRTLAKGFYGVDTNERETNCRWIGTTLRCLSEDR